MLSTVQYQQLAEEKEDFPTKEFKPFRILVPLPKELLDFLNGSDYANFIFGGGSPADFWQTYILRDPSVVFSSLNGKFDVGPTIHFFASCLPLAICYTVGIGLLCGLGFRKQYKKLTKSYKKRCSNYLMILRCLSEESDLLDDEDAIKELDEVLRYNYRTRKKIELYNKMLEELYKEDLALQRKYASAPKLVYTEPNPGEKINIYQAKLEFFARTDEELNYLAEQAKIQERNDKKFKRQDIDDEETSAFTPFNNKYLKPFWRNWLKPIVNKILVIRKTLFVAAFVYWLEWISAPIFVGGALGVGVIGLPVLVALCIPLLVAAPFLALEIADYIENESWKKNQEEIDKTKEATAESDDLAIEVNRRIEKEMLLKEQQKLSAKLGKNFSPIKVRHHLKGNYIVEGGGTWAKLKASSTFATSFQSEYGADQYIWWYLTDTEQLLRIAKILLGVTIAVPIIGPLAGLVCFLPAILISATLAYRRYEEIQSEKAEPIKKGHSQRPNLRRVITVERLEEIQKTQEEKLVEQHNELLDLQMQINKLIHNNQDVLRDEKPVFMPNCMERVDDVVNPPPPEGFFSRAYDYFNDNMTGNFFWRLFTVEGTAIAGVCLLAAFITVPYVALPLVIVGGFIFATLKHIENKQKETAEKIKTLPGKIKANDKEIELAAQTIENWKLRLQVLQKKVEDGRRRPELAEHKTGNNAKKSRTFLTPPGSPVLSPTSPTRTVRQLTPPSSPRSLGPGSPLSAGARRLVASPSLSPNDKSSSPSSSSGDSPPISGTNPKPSRPFLDSKYIPPSSPPDPLIQLPPAGQVIPTLA